MDNVSHFYAAPFLDRKSLFRRDEAWLANVQQAQETRFIAVWREKNLVEVGEEGMKGVFLANEQIQPIKDKVESYVLLGEAFGVMYMALVMKPEEDWIDGVWAKYGEWKSLRRLLRQIPAHDAGLLALAKAMAYWHIEHRFCSKCGHPTLSHKGGFSRICTNINCQKSHFPRTDAAIIVSVFHDDRILLARKASWPALRCSILAGFVEPSETLEETVIREVWEETAIEVYQPTYITSQPWPFPASLMLGFTALAKNERLILQDEELEQAFWFSRQDLKNKLLTGEILLPMDTSVSYFLIEKWFNEGREGNMSEIVRAIEVK